MSAFVSRRRRGHAEEESYFISMTDMMVGLVFVLIVLLVYFALQFHKTTAELTDTKLRRTELLQRLQSRLHGQHLEVAIDANAGVLRLPEDVLFAKGSSDVSAQGQAALAKVGQALAVELPCFTQPDPLPALCPQTKTGIESVFIEGHSDSDPVNGGRDNWNLSTDRAVNTYRSLIASTPSLGVLKNARLRSDDPQPILGVSGYGPTRPIVAETSEANKARNRRIDVRILMATHDANEHG
ncbi:MAG: OmpA/MotB family protein [Caulobacteraceae bacterium]